MTPAAPHGNELYFLSFRITSRYIVTLDCTRNVHQKSNGLLKSSQSDDVKSLWISYYSVVSDGIGNAEKPSISKHFLASGVTSRWLIGATPKRKAVGSNPARDASKHAENLWFIRVFGFSYFCGFCGFFAKKLGLLTFANEIWPFAKKGGKSEVRFLPKELANIC